MADLSKVQIGGVIYNLKDATARANLATLLGTHAVEALGTAAWKAADAAITSEGAGVATTAAVKSYVDSQIETIPKLDIVVCAAQADQIPAGAVYRDGATVITGTMAATKDTMYKIYLVKDDTTGMTGAYREYITIKNGDVYSWEMIGSTVVDLSNYVQKTTQIAGVAISDGIAKADLQSALDLKALAYCSEGEVKIFTADSITMDSYTPAGTIAISTSESIAAASLTKAAYTPAGSVKVGEVAGGNVVTGGSINVTVKDATTATAITDLEYDNYTPAGAVAATSEFAALKTATFQADNDGVQITGEVSKPDVNLTSAAQAVLTGVTSAGATPTFSEGAFTPAAISDGFFSAGSYTEGTLSQGELPTINTKPTSAFNTDGIKASVDSETLVFEAAATANALTDVTLNAGTLPFWNSGSYTAPSIDATKFSGGSKAADTFTAGSMPTFSDGSVNNVTGAALSAAPTFTGNKYKVAVTSDTAMKTAEFTGTAAAVKLKGAKYLKQEIDAKTFTPETAALSFAGTEVADFQVTGVNYGRISVNSATFTGTAATLTGTVNKTEKIVSVDFA